ncbi:transmembrane protein 132C-like [Sciurus carolinensis]|uniref:transmembrane protein 132C-like n=1 Tax=Sciurus carolinensis TaxID=30640 RepID=UPI001FB3DA78|nr:transmembrane protein 132C-like [Sciurus carolinensis]
MEAVVNFTYQYLSAPLRITVWVPRLSLQIEVSDTELSQIKGWRVPILASKRATRESEEEEEEERRDPDQTCEFGVQRLVWVIVLFSDSSATPLDVYDTQDFSLAASSLDEAVVSVAPTRSPRWPTVVAEGEGQGPLVQVDMTITEACQKSKCKSVLAVGFGNVRVKFGRNDTDPSPTRDAEEEETKNHASHCRKGQDESPVQDGPSPEREEGALRRATTRARSLLDGRAVKSRWLDGAGPPRGRCGAGGERPAAGAPGLSDLEIGMYALLGVFCLAILVFLINCATFALKYRHKQVPPEGQASVTHSHDWMWLGTGAELLGSLGDPAPPPEEHTTVIDRGLGGCTEGRHLLLNGDSQKHMQGQGRWPAESGRPGQAQQQEPPHSPTSKRKKVKFATFPTCPTDGGCPTVNSILGAKEDISWVHQDVDAGAPEELRDALEDFQGKV